MLTDRVLLFTDVVDSTRLTEELGDEAASRLWTAHDRIARRLLVRFGGREIDKSDGFLLLFERIDGAVAFAVALHAELAGLHPPLHCRVGIHRGPMVVRSNSQEDIALGAKPIELDGVGKAVASRLMALARGCQTLLSTSARVALADDAPWHVQSHGHWRLRGIAEPIEIFQVGDDKATFTPPPDGSKAYRVVKGGEGWIPAAQLPHGLPAERDAFIGRTSSLTALAARLDDDNVRLVTLVGIGGVGKTRVALRYAREWLGSYPGGAWFCDLSSARSADGIVHAVAQGLDVPLGKTDPVQQLGRAIEGRGECLVILDNFEQVARHAESTLGNWMARAARARFLVTSREVLGIAGEEALTLAPLSVLEATALFKRRAQSANNHYASPPADEDALLELVDLLDRLPLAIELAAARVRVMSVPAMLRRMGERFKLLVAQRGRQDRQSTLRATLDWSWELLSPVEQEALAQLSVFEGGFTLEAAEAVVDLSGPPGIAWVTDVIQSLVEKSLVRHGPGARFGLLRSVQDYAAERLNATAGTATSPSVMRSAAQRRHWHYFARTSEADATADRCADIENLYIACRRAMSEDPRTAVSALQSTWHALRLTGPFRIALDLIEAIEDMPGLADADRAIVDRVAGAAMYLLGDVDGAQKRFESSLARARSAGRDLELADSLCLTAELEMSQGRPAGAQWMLEEALRIADERQSSLVRLRALNGLGALNLRRSRLEVARQHYEEAMHLAQTAGDRRRLGGLHGNLGLLDQLQGHPVRAREHYSTALTMARDVGDRQWEGNTRCNLGLLLHELGETDKARIELEAALLVGRSIGHRRLEATTLCNLGIVADAQGQPPLALALHRGAVEVARGLGDRRLLGQFLGYLGLEVAAAQNPIESNACFDEGMAALSEIDDPVALALLQCQRARAAAHLGDEVSRRRWYADALVSVATNPPEPGSELAWAFERARQPAVTQAR